jgi:C1A family cysteine protease
VKTLAKQGACPEAKWPYIISKFRTKPSAACYSAALKDRAVTYARVNNSSLVALQGVLASGFPIVLGFSVYESFESQAVAKTGIVPMPTLHESLLGGHAVMCVGYDDAIKRFRVRNSWGAEWGQKGYFEIPYDYLTNLNLADDFWVLKLVG